MSRVDKSKLGAILSCKGRVLESYVYECDGVAVDFGVTKDSILLAHKDVEEGITRQLSFEKKDADKIVPILRAIADDLEQL